MRSEKGLLDRHQSTILLFRSLGYSTCHQVCVEGGKGYVSGTSGEVRLPRSGSLRIIRKHGMHFYKLSIYLDQGKTQEAKDKKSQVKVSLMLSVKKQYLYSILIWDRSSCLGKPHESVP